MSFGALTTLRTVRKEIEDINSGISITNVLKTYFDDYEKWVPRGKTFNKLMYYSTGQINSEQVILGKDDWLFYNLKSDGDPLGDYTGSKTYTETDLKNILKSAEIIQNDIKNRSIEFCLLIAPNKENIYYRHMPERYPHIDVTRTDVLIRYLDENGIEVVDPKQELLKYSYQYKTYYKNDTHWNQLGGYIGVRSVLEFFGYDVPGVNDDSIQEGNEIFSDLLDVSKLHGVFKYDYGLNTKYSVNYREISRTDERKLKVINNENALYDKTVFIIGDSFSTAMQSSISYFFKNVYVIWRDNYQSGMIDEINPDYVVLEFVERYSDRIAGFSL